ncbi:hypothetical protein [Butyrivibrio sp. VCD2006]|uniref:hypothetical protein n=1 Tax=Butyrivibrio sp. VCD2006 TaxID=1280664 RepID=UPI000402F00B|nr:hypothetical protein [Butyrivibrio sp. VCD2006]
MNQIYHDEWSDYLRIISEHSDINYSKLKKIRISKRKQQFGGCCLKNGIFFGIPNSSRELLQIDPSSYKASYFGKTRIGTFKWTGGCNFKGNCYGFSRKENSILTFDNENGMACEIGLGTRYRGEHHYGGSMVKGGIVYQPPRNTDHVLKIDLNSFKSTQIKMPGVIGGVRYSCSVLHPNGDIYLIPEFGYKPAILHTDTEKIEYFGEESDYLVFSAVVGMDGNIYGYKKNGNGILCINVKEKTVYSICKTIGEPDCYGSLVGINGRIYGIPAGGNTIWEYDLRNQEVSRAFELDERGYAKCGGGGIAPNGSLVLMPCYGDMIYILECNKADLQVKTNNLFFNMVSE